MARIKNKKHPKAVEETKRGAAGLARSTAGRAHVVPSKKIYRRTSLTKPELEGIEELEVEDCDRDHERICQLTRPPTEDEISFLKEIGDYY